MVLTFTKYFILKKMFNSLISTSGKKLMRPPRYNPEQHDNIVKLASEGRSYTEIAIALNSTRGSISGYASRQGIALVNQRYPRKLVAKPARIVKTSIPLEEPSTALRKLNKFKILKVLNSSSLPYSEKSQTDGIVHLLHARPDSCRWPIGEARELICCGARVVADRCSYCPEHRRIATASIKTSSVENLATHL